jgi:DNA-binding MarR family transcriptional regulator
MTDGVDPDQRRPAAAPPDDALETSRLLLELVHVIYATRAAEAETAAGSGDHPERERDNHPDREGTSPHDRLTPIHGSTASQGSTPHLGSSGARPAPSTHAIRAAVHVHQHGDRTIGELADGLGISYGWASRVVRELESGGLVERRVDPSDRRVVHVSLTPEASAMVERTYRWRGEAVQRALAGLSLRQREGVRAFLRSVTEELARRGQDRGVVPPE